MPAPLEQLVGLRLAQTRVSGLLSLPAERGSGRDQAASLGRRPSMKLLALLVWRVSRVFEWILFPLMTGYWLAQATASLFWGNGPDWRAMGFICLGLLWLVLDLKRFE